MFVRRNINGEIFEAFACRQEEELEEISEEHEDFINFIAKLSQNTSISNNVDVESLNEPEIIT